MPPFNIDKLIATGAIPQERAVTEEFKQATKEWVELKKQLNAVNKDVRVCPCIYACNFMCSN